MIERADRRYIRPLVLVLVSILALALPAAAQPADYVGQVNGRFARIQPNKRSDLVLLPALAAMEAPPAPARDVREVMLIGPGSSGWNELEAWATGAPQKAVLRALSDITAEEDYRKAMVFAQGYGVEAVAAYPEIISAGLYTELGEPPTLAAARHGYLEKMTAAEILAQIEATRLSAAGDAPGAIEVLFDILYVGRQMVDRPFAIEKKWGGAVMARALERIRDVAFQDFHAEKHSLTAEKCKEIAERLEPKADYVSGERVTLPEGDIIAAEEILRRVLVQGGGTNPETFAIVMARIGAADRPLRLLSESAYWERVRERHAGWTESMDTLRGRTGDAGLAGDWAKRWSLTPFDPINRSPSEFSRLSKSRHAVLALVLAGIDDLFPLRQIVRTEIAGTRTSIAVYGWSLQNGGALPAEPLVAIVPTFVPAVDTDPYSSARRALGYFVPMRDTGKGPRGQLLDYVVNIYPGDGLPSFRMPARDNNFIVFSVGPDDDSTRASDITQADPTLEGDYLLWPPLVAVVRKHLADTGKLP
jgi:hypothetical protein